MKKLWGLVLCIAFAVGGCLTGFFVANDEKKTVNAADAPVMLEDQNGNEDSVTVYYKDDQLILSEIPLVDNMNAEKEENRTVSIDRDGLIGFKQYNWYGAHTFTNRDGSDYGKGTYGTFRVTLPKGHSLYPSEDWYVIERAKDATSESYDITQFERVPSMQANTFNYRFREAGVYTFKIVTWDGVSMEPNLSTPDNPDDYIESYTYTYFKMVARRQPPKFAPVFPQESNEANRRNRAVLIGTGITEEVPCYIEFEYAGGYDVLNPRFKIDNDKDADNRTILGLPNFMEFKGYYEPGENLTDPDVPNVNAQIVIGKVAGNDLVKGLYGYAAGQQIMFQVEYDAYDDLTTKGVVMTSGTTATVGGITLILEDDVAPATFPWWTLLAGFGIIGALVLGWYLSDRLSVFVQVRDIRKQRKKEELSELARLENMEKMRQETHRLIQESKSDMARRLRPDKKEDMR